MKHLGKIIGGVLGLGAAGLGFWEWKTSTEEPKHILPATKGTKMDFIKKMQDAISSASSSLFSDAGKLLVIAWAAFETNFGRTSGWTGGNNAFNITAGSLWKGETVPGPDTEYDASGNVKNITQAWRKYPTVLASIEDMLSFISESRFGSAKSKLQSGDSSFSDDLYKGKYFTLPPEKYKAGVEEMLRSVKLQLGLPS